MSQRTTLHVYLGKHEQALGRLVFAKDGAREFSQFAYSDDWLADPLRFDVSPDLGLQSGYQLRKAPTPHDSCFFGALADTEPDAWGRRVIARAHAKKRAHNPNLAPLSAVDYLAAVDDLSRVGALRLRNETGEFVRTTPKGERSTPTLLELGKVLQASRAVELSQETTEDLAYLQGKGTSLGGMRPKCTLLDTDGALALGKFPSVGDERAVTRGEVLALHVAQRAGVHSADARIVLVNQQPVAVIRRFDRTADQSRLPYMSGATLLQASRQDELSYTQLVDAMRSVCADFASDARQLWRRLVLNHLITNVDDHLQNIGFLYTGRKQWRLAPAFDLNPFPDKSPESKTWLSEDTGPITSIHQLLSQAAFFELTPPQAQAVVAEVKHAVQNWKTMAASPDVGMQAAEMKAFEAAFKEAFV